MKTSWKVKFTPAQMLSLYVWHVDSCSHAITVGLFCVALEEPVWIPGLVRLSFWKADLKL